DLVTGVQTCALPISHSLPRVEGWEAGLGSHDVGGLRVAVDPRLGRAVVHPEVEAIVTEAAEGLIKAAGLRQVEVPIVFPDAGPRSEERRVGTECRGR